MSFKLFIVKSSVSQNLYKRHTCFLYSGAVKWGLLGCGVFQWPSMLWNTQWLLLDIVYNRQRGQYSMVCVYLFSSPEKSQPSLCITVALGYILYCTSWEMTLGILISHSWITIQNGYLPNTFVLNDLQLTVYVQYIWSMRPSNQA